MRTRSTISRAPIKAQMWGARARVERWLSAAAFGSPVAISQDPNLQSYTGVGAARDVALAERYGRSAEDESRLARAVTVLTATRTAKAPPR